MSSPVDRVNSESESNPSPSQVAESLVSGLFITKYKVCCKHKYLYDSP